MAFPRPNPLTTSSSSIVDFDLLTRNKGEEEQRQAAYALLGRNGSKFKDPLDGLPPSIKARIARKPEMPDGPTEELKQQAREERALYEKRRALQREREAAAKKAAAEAAIILPPPPVVVVESKPAPVVDHNPGHGVVMSSEDMNADESSSAEQVVEEDEEEEEEEESDDEEEEVEEGGDNSADSSFNSVAAVEAAASDEDEDEGEGEGSDKGNSSSDEAPTPTPTNPGYGKPVLSSSSDDEEASASPASPTPSLLLVPDAATLLEMAAQNTTAINAAMGDKAHPRFLIQKSPLKRTLSEVEPAPAEPTPPITRVDSPAVSDSTLISSVQTILEHLAYMFVAPAPPPSPIGHAMTPHLLARSKTHTKDLGEACRRIMELVRPANAALERLCKPPELLALTKPT